MLACATPTQASPEGRTGSRAGYEAHRRAGEPICAACQRAQQRVSKARPPKQSPRRRAREQLLAFLAEVATETRSVAADHTPTPGWRDHATCRGMPTSWWFPSSDDPADITAGVKLCRVCPVRADCAAEHQMEQHGVWGGIHPAVDLICAWPTSTHPEGRTGTQAGYAAHQRAGDTPCAECVLALRWEDRYREANKRGQQTDREWERDYETLPQPVTPGAPDIA